MESWLQQNGSNALSRVQLAPFAFSMLLRVLVCCFFQKFRCCAFEALSSHRCLAAITSGCPLYNVHIQEAKGWEDDLDCICQCKNWLLDAEPCFDKLQGVPPLPLSGILEWVTLRKDRVRFPDSSADELRSWSHAAWCSHTVESNELAAAGEPTSTITRARMQDDRGDVSGMSCYNRFYPRRSITVMFASTFRPTLLQHVLCCSTGKLTLHNFALLFILRHSVVMRRLAYMYERHAASAPDTCGFWACRSRSGA